MENDTYVNTTHSLNDSEGEWVLPDFHPSPGNIAMAVVLTTLVIVTILGNFIVLVAFLVDTKLRQPFNLYIMNLAVTDFLVAITAMPFYTIDTLFGYWPFGQLMCGVWIYFDFAMTFASVFTMVAISVDRFWCVTWAIHYKHHNNLTKTIIVLVVVWISVFGIWTPPFIGDRIANKEIHFCIWEPNENRQFVLLVAVIGHYIPCAIMVGCYIKVFLVMRQQAKRIGASTRSCMTATTTYQRSFMLSKTGMFSKTEKSDTVTSSRHESDGPSIDKEGMQNGTRASDRNGTQLLQVRSISAHISDHDKDSRSESRISHNQSGPSSLSRDKKIFITLTYVISSYLICWFPFYVTFDTYAWRPELVPSSLYSFFFWMTYVNSTLNPFIYAYTSKDFRSAFARVIRCAYSCKIK